MILSPVLKQRFFDSNGNPLAGGKLYSFAAGTTTPLATYSDSSGTTNANPVILDASGQANVWMDSGSSYKFVLKDSSDVTQFTVDTITTAGSVGTASIVDDAVTQSKIADDAVGAAQLQDDAVTDANRAVTTNHIRDQAITANKLGAILIDGVTLEITGGTTVQVKNRGISPSKLVLNTATSVSSGTYSTTSASYVTVISGSITCTGNPIDVRLQPSGAALSYLGASTSGMQVRLTVGGSTLAEWYLITPSSQSVIPVGAINFVDLAASAGSRSYALQVLSLGGTAFVYHAQLVFREY